MPDVTVTTTPTLLCAAKSTAARGSVTLELRLAQAREAYIGIGDAAVTTSTGRLLQRGFGMSIENDGDSNPAKEAIYAIVASGSVVIRVHEQAP